MISSPFSAKLPAFGEIGFPYLFTDCYGNAVYGSYCYSSPLERDVGFCGLNTNIQYATIYALPDPAYGGGDAYYASCQIILLKR
jgi:hypothetical protein